MPKRGEKSVFFHISWKIAFWKDVNGAKILQWLCLLHMARSNSGKFKSFGPHLQKYGVKVSKNGQKCTKTGYPNTFAPRITSLDHKKSKLSRFFGLNFSFVYYKFLKFCPKTYWQGAQKRVYFWLLRYMKSFDSESINNSCFKLEL